MICEDIEVLIGRLIVIDAANTEEYTKEINTMASKRVSLDRGVMECLLLERSYAHPHGDISRQRQGQYQEGFKAGHANKRCPPGRVQNLDQIMQRLLLQL